MNMKKKEWYINQNSIRAIRGRALATQSHAHQGELTKKTVETTVEIVHRLHGSARTP